jgi:hypothetical protein
MAQVCTSEQYQVRYYTNANQYNVVGTYFNITLAYGMRKKFNLENPLIYPLGKIKVKHVNDR